MSEEGIILFGIRGIPDITHESNLVDEILNALSENNQVLLESDILVIAHTVVSKWEERVVSGDDVEVSKRAQEIADRNGFDPVQAELALQEAIEIIKEDGVLITQTRSGLICNFSGVDKSNAPEGFYILLPEDSDTSAERIRDEILKKVGLCVAVIISDTQGRPWRKGSINLAIGCAGINAYKHNKGKRDLYGRVLQRSMVCQIDELASASENIMGQADEGIPVVVIRGYKFEEGPERAKNVIRPKHEDLFR